MIKLQGEQFILFNGKGCTSSFNTYKDCATNLVGAGNPIAPVVELDKMTVMVTIGDWFERNDTDELTFPRVEHNGKEVYTSLADNSLSFGYHKQFAGKKITLTDNTSSATTTGLSFSRTKETNLQISYTISRNTRVRTGTLLITNTTGDCSISDDFIEEADVGVSFTLDRSGGTTNLFYTTNNQSANGDFYYKIDRYY